MCADMCVHTHVHRHVYTHVHSMCIHICIDMSIHMSIHMSIGCRSDTLGDKTKYPTVCRSPMFFLKAECAAHRRPPQPSRVPDLDFIPCTLSAISARLQFVRTVSAYSSQVPALTMMVKQFSWKSCAMLSSTDNVFLIAAGAWNQRLEADNVTVAPFKTFGVVAFDGVPS